MVGHDGGGAQREGEVAGRPGPIRPTWTCLLRQGHMESHFSSAPRLDSYPGGCVVAQDGDLSLSLHAAGLVCPGPPKTGLCVAAAPSRPNRAGPPNIGNPCCFGGQPAQLASGTVHCAPPTTLTFSTTPDRIAAPIRLHRATNAVQMAPGQYQSAVRNPDTSGRQMGGTAAYSPHSAKSCPN